MEVKLLMGALGGPREKASPPHFEIASLLNESIYRSVVALDLQQIPRGFWLNGVTVTV